MPSPEEFQAEICRLQTENARLRALLDSHGIPWKPPVEKTLVPPVRHDQHVVLSTNEKVALFRRRFQGQTDVYPIRWEATRSGKSGYSPACGNEWKRGVCQKPHIKCSQCDYRELLPLADQTIYDHLAGRHTIGVYPLLLDETCFFLAVDFNEESWQADSLAFVESCRESGVPASLEISRSGKGAHVWIFFSEPVFAR